MKIAVVNDLSGMGGCSLMAAIPVLNVLGHKVYPLPTAVLSNQTDYGTFSFADFTCHMAEYVQNWKKLGLRLDCVYSGFLSDERQVRVIRDMHASFGCKLLVVDPVMGDGGNVYATMGKDLCAAIKSLVAEADLATPNVTEACILTGTDYREFLQSVTDDNFFDRYYSLAKKVAEIGCKHVVITGVERNEGLRYVHNFIWTDGEGFFTKNRMFGGRYSGTGDLTASVITGCLLCGKDLCESVRIAADFVEAAVKDAFHRNIARNDGVDYEKFLPALFSAVQSDKI